MDGTLIESFLHQGESGLEPDPDFPYEKVKLRKGAAAMVRVLAREGAEFALITNQGGVAFGHQTEAVVGQRIGEMLRQLNWFEREPFSVHVCYTHPHATVEKYRLDDVRRKPGGGMLLEAMDAHGASRDETVYVGDMNSDCWTAEGVGVNYFHVDEFMRELHVGPRALKSGA